jgi:hypothetical protein
MLSCYAGKSSLRARPPAKGRALRTLSNSPRQDPTRPPSSSSSSNKAQSLTPTRLAVWFRRHPAVRQSHLRAAQLLKRYPQECCLPRDKPPTTQMASSPPMKKDHSKRQTGKSRSVAPRPSRGLAVVHEARRRVRWRLYCRNGIGHLSAIKSGEACVFALGVATSAEVLGGGPWRKTTATFDTPPQQQ